MYVIRRIKVNIEKKGTYYYFGIKVLNKLLSHIKILSQIVKVFKSAYKNSHHFNPLYTSYQYSNSNTATQHSHNTQTSSADQTFYYSRGACVCPHGQTAGGFTNLINGELSMSGATHLLQIMPTWCGQGKLLLCCCSAILHLERQ